MSTEYHCLRIDTYIPIYLERGRKQTNFTNNFSEQLMYRYLSTSRGAGNPMVCPHSSLVQKVRIAPYLPREWPKIDKEYHV